MTEKDKPSVLRETDDDARRLARTLLRSARSCALAVIEPESGAPFASRTLTGTDTDGTPVILVSSLSVHTQALRRDQAQVLVEADGPRRELELARQFADGEGLSGHSSARACGKTAAAGKAEARSGPTAGAKHRRQRRPAWLPTMKAHL